MHAEYGINPDYRCKDCNNLCCHEYSRRYYKCRLYGLSASDATDWRVGYTACGMWGKDGSGLTVMIERLKRERTRHENPLNGQLDMFGGEYKEE